MIKFLKNWNGLFTIPLALVIWFMSPPIIRSMDPTAGVFDAGTLQLFLFAIMGVLIADFMAWLLILLSWPTLQGYIERFKSDFLATTPNIRILCIISVFALHFLGFVLLVHAM